MPWCRKDFSHTDIHPGHLSKTFPCTDQPVCIHVDPKLCPVLISIHDPLHHRIHFPDKLHIFCCFIIQIHAIDKQQCRIDCIVQRLVSSLRKQIRHQTVSLILCKGAQNPFCSLKLSGRNADSRKCNHRISAPVFKKRIPCQYCISPRGFPF